MVSSFDLILAIGSTGTVLVFGYSVFWAFEIRNALAIRIYRHQALGTGLIGINFAAIILFFLFFVYTLEIPLFVAWQAAIQSNFFLLFYWIDASMLAALRSDPLLRDTLSWKRARAAFLVILIIAVAANLSVTAGLIPRIPQTIQGLLTPAPVYVILIIGAIFLPVYARRSGDATLRRHLVWFTASVALLFLGVLGFSFLAIPLGPPSPAEVVPRLQLPIQALIVLYASTILSGIGWYKSAKSLVPLNRLSLAEVVASGARASLGRPLGGAVQLMSINLRMGSQPAPCRCDRSAQPQWPTRGTRKNWRTDTVLTFRLLNWSASTEWWIMKSKESVGSSFMNSESR